MASAGKSVLNDQELRDALSALNQELRAKSEEKRKRRRNQQDRRREIPGGEQDQTGVITLPSGLQYKILAEGSGESPKSNGRCDGELSRHPHRRHRVR
jgi:FKBP-type peptidyl-prolyl cis-trans isomerase